MLTIHLLRGRPTRHPVPARGFTLIELMITVAIVAILASVALPAYENSVKKGKRAQGRTALIDAMQAQERYFTQRNIYLQVATAGDSSGGIKMTSGDSPSTAAYKLKAEVCDGTGMTFRDCVKLVAEPQFSDGDANKLILESTGKKSCTGSKPNVCWP